MASAGPAIARAAATARHVKRVFFIEISSLQLTVRNPATEVPSTRTIPSPPAIRFHSQNVETISDGAFRLSVSHNRPRKNHCQGKKAKFMLPDHRNRPNPIRRLGL